MNLKFLAPTSNDTFDLPDFIGNKIADKITSLGKPKEKKIK